MGRRDGRLLDQVGLGPGASCLDAGCGPGETMRAMAERVGPAGRVLGVDADAALGGMTLEMLHGDGYRQCAFRAQDRTAGDPIPGAPYDLVYTRLLLFHLPQRVAVLARLWEARRPWRSPARPGLRPARLPLAAASAQLERVVRSVLPTALAHGITTEDQAETLLASMDRDVLRFPDLPTLIGAWKRKRQS